MDTAALALRVHAYEEAALRTARRRLGTPAVVAGARGLSQFGEHAGGWLALGVAGAVVDRRRRSRWTRAVAAVAAAHVAASATKRLVRRARPAFDDLPVLVRTASALSFPSSHASSTTAAAVAYGRLLPSAPFAVAALAMGCARVLVGAHYVTDVLAGAALGAACARVLTAGEGYER